MDESSVYVGYLVKQIPRGVCTDSELWKWQITSCCVYVYVYGMNFLSKTQHRSASVVSFMILTLADVFCIEGSFISKIFSLPVYHFLLLLPSLPSCFWSTLVFLCFEIGFFFCSSSFLFFCWLFWIRQYDLCLSSTCLSPAWDLPASFC